MPLKKEERTQRHRSLLRPFIRGLLRRNFPTWRVVRILAGTDRARHQTAALLRVLLERHGRRIALVIVYPTESTDLTHRVLSASVLWWDRLESTGNCERLFILLPEDWSERLLCMFPRLSIRVTCCKYSQADPHCLRQIYPRPVETSEVGSPYVIFGFAGEAPKPMRELRERFPDLDLTYRQNRWELGYLGLRVFWYDESVSKYLFNLRKPAVWRPEKQLELELHLAEVRALRRFPPPEPDHSCYRTDPEQWLESVILRNHQVIRPDFVNVIYSQVPTCLDGERKILDLLTATRQGRLAVLELKVDKDLNLVFQGLDYWERVWRHLREGDFQEAGYFSGMRLSLEPPLLYLISPLFEYHRVLPVLRKYMKSEVSLGCIGINSNWREGLKVLRRFEF